MPASRTIDSARIRVIRITSRVFGFVWLPLTVTQAIVSFMQHDPYAESAAIVAAIIGLIAVVLWRPTPERLLTQAKLFLVLVYVGVAVSLSARGLQARSTAGCALFVVWGALFFGRRGLWGTIAALAPFLGVAVYRVGAHGDVAIPADATGFGGAMRTAIFVLVGLIICGLVVNEALYGYLSAVAAEHDALQAQHEERLKRAAAEDDAEMLQRRQLAAALAVGLAHDLNNAVQVTATNAAILAESASDEDREVAQEIVHAAARAGAMVRGLQSFGRAVADNQTSFSAEEAMGGLRIILRGYTPRAVTTSFDCRTSAHLAGAELRFSQVVINLVVNAIDAMPHGGTLSLDIADGDADACVVRVKDSGTGIAPEIRERMFEPYFTTKPARSGGGLGLSMVARIVAEVGGTIGVESSLGHGTTFSVRWPKAPPAP